MDDEKSGSGLAKKGKALYGDFDVSGEVLEMLARQTRIELEHGVCVTNPRPWERGSFSCAPSPAPGLATEKMLDDLARFRASLRRPAPLASMQMMESVHLTATKEKWIRVRRTWRERLFGGQFSRDRVGVMLTAMLLAALLGGLFLPLLAALSLRPRRWRCAYKPVKIYEQVPDPAYYILNGAIVAHPVTMVALRAQLQAYPRGTKERRVRWK